MGEHAAVNYRRPVGIEIECLCAVTENKSRYEFQIALARILTANGIRTIARGYSKAPLPNGIDAAVEFDESVVGMTHYNGIDWANIEVKTRKLDGLREFDGIVARLMEILRFLNASVNETTGLHVSLGVAAEVEKPHFLRSLLNLLYRFEPVIYGLVARHRVRSGYAEPLPPKLSWQQCPSTLMRYHLPSSWHRTCGVNLRPLYVQSRPGCERIEFRWHEGTLLPVNVRHWIVFLNRLVDHASMHVCKTATGQVANDRNGFEKLMTTVGFRTNSKLYTVVDLELIQTRKYLLRRWKRLSALAER